jgi:hypothetical protein
MEMIDQSVAWRFVEERLNKTENPRHRSMLEVVIGHLKAEENLDLDGLMASLVDNPVYRTWRDGQDIGPKGYEAVKAYYAALVQARRGILEYRLDRLVLDDDAVVTEGTIRAYQPGRAARTFGFNVDDVDATYLVSYRALIVWPFNEAGQLIGEDGYGNWDPDSAVRVGRQELPDAYIALFDSSEYATVGIAE